jgi:hypothetical protein
MVIIVYSFVAEKERQHNRCRSEVDRLLLFWRWRWRWRCAVCEVGNIGVLILAHC